MNFCSLIIICFDKNIDRIKITKKKSLSKNNYSVSQKTLLSDLNCPESSSSEYFQFNF